MLKPWVEGFIAECAAFPKGANDDQVDAWSQGAKRLLRQRPKIARPVFVEPKQYYSERSWMA
jgi:phage terminase large subunit-like protein